MTQAKANSGHAPQLGKKAAQAEAKAARAAARLDKAMAKLPAKRKLTLRHEAKGGKASCKLRFEKSPKTAREHLKGPMALRPAKAAGKAAVAYAHKKIHQAENGNVGVEAAHRGEIAAERIARSALRHRKTSPYRKANKLGRASQKAGAEAACQKAMRDGPKKPGGAKQANSPAPANGPTRASAPTPKMAQKRNIKKGYAKAARGAKNAASNLKGVGGKAADAASAAAKFAKAHPHLIAAALCAAGLLMAVAGAVSSCGSMLGGSGAVALAACYLADDEDIDCAELSYTEWETDLLLEFAATERTHPGYDEYRYSCDEVGHDPFELMAYLTAAYGGFTYAEILPELERLFGRQYSVTHTLEAETRYRTEKRAESATYTDPSTGESHTYTYTHDVEVAYAWRVMAASLAARPFTDAALPLADPAQTAAYSLLMQNKGRRQYLSNVFGSNWLPCVSEYYGYRIHPISGGKDCHRGVDIAAAEGTPIFAGMDGVVAEAGHGAEGYGSYIAVSDGKGLTAKYAHLSEMLVTRGQAVHRGDAIGKVGSTGAAASPRLHLEVLKGGAYLNPIFFAETGDDSSGRIPPGMPGGRAMPAYPGEPMPDGLYAAVLAEAQKHLGKQYVWGASGPDSFDCSGYVSYVLGKSGAASIGRQTAQGLFDRSTPVSKADARPGDLVFFTKTYSSANPVTHVGIYIGNGMMIHCGKPVQYASFETPWWDSHFYSFGRLPA